MADKANAGTDTPRVWRIHRSGSYHTRLHDGSALVSEVRAVNTTTGEERYNLVLVGDQEALPLREQSRRAWRAQKRWMDDLNGRHPGEMNKTQDDAVADDRVVSPTRAHASRRPGGPNIMRMDAAAAHQYRRAALADGWSSEPMSEGRERLSARLHRERFEMHVYVTVPANVAPCGYVWIEDAYGLSIKTPYPYSWDATLAGVRVCDVCGATDVDTERWGLGRFCEACRSTIRARS